MLNKDNIRELCYLVTIDTIEPIIGSDNCEAAVVGGWRIMVRKNTFVAGDIAIYFEIDSRVPATEQFAFLEKKHYKVKTQKYTFGGKGNFISQGLLMAPEDFGWEVHFGMGYDDGEVAYLGPSAGQLAVLDDEKNWRFVDDESRFLTNKLGVIYSVEDDNKRKANSSNDKYKKMVQRHPRLFQNPIIKRIYKTNIGKKILFVFFGKKKDTRNWPEWVQKTDEERVQNMPWILEDKSHWIATEKIDGTSTTFTLKREKNILGRETREFLVCSRNVVFDKPDKKCFYDSNVYLEMAEKYRIEEFLNLYLDSYKDTSWVTLQGETYGSKIQVRDYGLSEHKFMGFNLIDSAVGRWNSVYAKEACEKNNIPWVPIIDTDFVMPDTVDELLKIATGKSTIDGGMREGLVFRSKDGIKSFKAVSNEFLLKYHS